MWPSPPTRRRPRLRPEWERGTQGERGDAQPQAATPPTASGKPCEAGAAENRWARTSAGRRGPSSAGLRSLSGNANGPESGCAPCCVRGGGLLGTSRGRGPAWVHLPSRRPGERRTCCPPGVLCPRSACPHAKRSPIPFLRPRHSHINTGIRFHNSVS